MLTFRRNKLPLSSGLYSDLDWYSSSGCLHIWNVNVICKPWFNIRRYKKVRYTNFLFPPALTPPLPVPRTVSSFVPFRLVSLRLLQSTEGILCYFKFPSLFPFLGRVRKIAKSDHSLHICLSIPMELLGCHWTDFHEIWYLSIFRKPVKKIQVSLKSDNNNRYFTWIPIYIFDHISLSSS